MINPASKIKSHLIREIDFEQIDAALYRKPKLKDRFAEICDEIKTRRRKSVRNKSVVESNWRTL